MATDPELRGEIAAGEPREDLAARAAWGGAPELFAEVEPAVRFTAGVSGPGLAARNAGNDRAPRPAAASAWAPADDRGNWTLTGPRNIGGRISALAVARSDPQRWYAGSASGGPYRSNDGGQTWFPLWHDETSLAVGAIAVSPQDPDKVYVATGENDPAGLAIRGHGIFVSTNGGEDWLAQAPGAAPHPPHHQGFDAIAVDPTNADHCLAVGKDGIFHTRNGGGDWNHVQNGTYFSDVAFLDGRVYLVRGTSTAGEGAIFRIDNPLSLTTVAAFEAELANPANQKVVAGPLAAHEAWPGRGKIAVFSGPPGRIYARFVDTQGRHIGVWRCTNPRAGNAAATTWRRQEEHPDWVEEDQGAYNLAIAVNPDDRRQVATGMVLIHASNDGGVGWSRAMYWGLHDDGLRSHHADQHQFTVSPDGHLWVGNDGGIFESENWADGGSVFYSRPVPPGAVRWRRRDLGITASQMYDLNQSSLLPGLQAMGMQDNASHMTTGGATWRQVGGGDGSFILFDSDDPYRYLVTTQNDIGAAQFPGYRDRHFPEEQPPGAPVTDRSVEQGFRPEDGPAFVADSDRHPTDPGRVLLAREGRLYGGRAETGENWRVEPVGSALDLVYEPGSLDRAEVRVAATLGAVRLGFVPGLISRRGRHEPLTDPAPWPAVVRLQGRLPGPFQLVDGDQLVVELDGVEHRATFSAAAVGDIGAVTVAEAVRVLTAAFPDTVTVLPAFRDMAAAVELTTRGLGAGQTITLSGPAVAPLPVDGLSPLGVNAGTYRGTDGLPASVTVGSSGFDHASSRVGRDLSGADRLDVSINGGPVRSVDLTGLPDRGNVSPGELAALLRAALAGDDVDVVAGTVTKWIRLTAHDGSSVLAAGSAAARLGLDSIEQESLALFGWSNAEVNGKHHVRNRNSFNLEPPGPAPLELSLSDGSSTAGPIQITAGSVGNLRSVTVEELYRIVVGLLDGSGVNVDVQLEMRVRGAPPSEVVLSDARPGEAWVGSEDGRVFRSEDGVAWTEVGSAEFRLGSSPIEAIALHPTDAATAFVGILSAGSTGHLPTLFKTTTGGNTWDRIDGVKVDGKFVGVHAIEIDPKAPDEVFVATSGGVFRSSDGGTTWRRFNEGLPNVPITDLAFEPMTGRLRAGAWGRGSFVRTVRAVTPNDVQLFLRASESDDGSGRPAPALPSLFAADPAPARPSSPDVKFVHALSAELAARRVDGVEFDLDLVNDPVVPGGAGVLLVQVHNAAALPASTVRIVVLHAPVDVGPPHLPSDFWTTFRAGGLAGQVGSWTVLADHTVPAPMPAGAPLVESLPAAWPADLGGPALGLLVLVEATGDLIEDGALTVEGLLTTERRAAYRQFPVVAADAARTLLMRASAGRTFEVAAPASAVGADASAAVDIAGGMVSGTTGLVEVVAAAGPAGATIALPATAALAVFEAPMDVTIDFDDTDGDFANIHQATPFEIARFVEARLLADGAQASIYPYPVGIRLRGLGGATISPTGGRARAALGWTAGHVAVLEATAADGFNFAGSGNPRLRLRIRGQRTHNIDIELDRHHFRDLRSVGGRRLAILVNRALAREQLPRLVRAEVIYGLAIYAEFDGTVTAAGTGATELGLPTDPFGWMVVAPGLVDLDGKSMTLTVRNGVNVRFDRYPHLLPDPAAATPAQVRRVINEHLAVANMPVRAVVGRSDLVAGALATSRQVPAVPPDAIFEYHGGYLAARLDGGEENHLYLRVANRGNLAAVDAVAKLHLLDMGATPIGRREVDDETVTVPAQGAEFVHFRFAAPDDTAGVWLLATAGLELPAAAWNSPREVLAWAAANRGAVLERFGI